MTGRLCALAALKSRSSGVRFATLSTGGFQLVSLSPSVDSWREKY